MSFFSQSWSTQFSETNRQGQTEIKRVLFNLDHNFTFLRGKKVGITKYAYPHDKIPNKQITKLVF